MKSPAHVIVISCLLFALTQATPASPQPAAPPATPFEALLLDAAGTPLHGPHDVLLRFMNAPVDGEPFLEATHTGPEALDVADGVLRVPLGAPGESLPTELRSALDRGRKVYLEVVIDGERLNPRIRVIASTAAVPRPSELAPPGNVSRGPAPEPVLRARSDRLMLYGPARAPGDPVLELPSFAPRGRVCSPGETSLEEDGASGDAGACDQWLSPAGELPDAAALRQAWRNYTRNGPLGFAPPGALERAWERRQEMEAGARNVTKSTTQSFIGDTWVNLGPAPLVDYDNVALTGRIRAVAVDPSDPNTIYAGAASGGVWRTSGGDWEPLTDFEKSLATGSIAIDPQDSNILYVGTGEIGGDLAGCGVLKSVDAGASWSLKGENWFCSFGWGARVGKVALDPRPVAYPAAERIVHLATDVGVWRSTNGGETWLHVLQGAFSDLVIDPTDPNYVYAAGPGVGIWQSQQSGAVQSWNKVVDSNDELPTASFGRMQLAVVVDPVSSNPILYASAEDRYISKALKGIWKSTTDGESWTRVGGHPVDFARGQSVSPDLGESESNDTFATADAASIGQVISGTISSTTDVDYFEVSVTGNMLNVEILAARMGSGLDPELRLYDSGFQLVRDIGGVPLGGNRGLRGTNDERLGMSGWAVLTPGTHYIEVRAHGSAAPGSYQLSITGLDLGCQCHYDQVLAVDPSDPDNMYAGLVRLLRSTDGGTNWSDIHNHGGANRIHNDIQGMAFHPTDSNTMFWATDGGLFKTTDRGDHWQSLNGNLSLIQIYGGMTQHAQSEQPILIGMQDNGSAVYYNGNWTQIRAGDGTFTGVADLGTWYVADLALNMLQVTNFGQNWKGVSPPGRSGAFGWAPFLVHPDQAQTLIAGGTYDGAGPRQYVVWRTPDGGDSWSHDSTNLQSAISALAYAPNDTNTQYAGTVNGRLWRTLDNGGSWYEIDWTGRPGALLTDLAVAPDDEYEVYAAYGGWTNAHVVRVRKQESGGTVSAVAISEASYSQAPPPVAPTWAVVVDPGDPDTILLGNEVGIFRTSDGGLNWQSFSRGLPNVPVTELILAPAARPGGALRAATYGRGVWDLQVDNDVCENALPIADGSHAGFTTDGTHDGSSTCEYTSQYASPDAFYEYVTPCGGVVNIDTCGSSFDTVLSVHADTCPADMGTEYLCNDTCPASPCDYPLSCISRPAVPGQTLKIRVGGNNGLEGDYKLNVSCSIPNDACGDATALATSALVSGSTFGGYSDGAASCNGVDVTSAGVWYSLIGTGNTITASLCDAATEFDTRLTVYCAGCGGQTCVTAGDDECGNRSEVSWCSAPGMVYHLLVHGAGAETGAFQLDVTEGAACGPVTLACMPGNNTCEQAQEVTLSNWMGDNTNAGTSTEVSCAQSSGDVWFRWEPVCNGFATLDTCGSFGGLDDTVLSLHDSCGGLEYACNDDGEVGCGLRSAVSYPAVAGDPIWIRVADWDTGTDPDRGDFPLHLDFATTGLTVPAPGLYIVGPGVTEDYLIRLDNDFYSAVSMGATGTTGLTGLAWAPDIGLMYGIDTDSDQMVTFDLDTGVATPFGPVGFNFVASLAWDPWHRVLYGFDASTRELLRIDAFTGEGEIVGPVGFTQVGSLALDPRTRILYGVDLATDVLLTIDLGTGAGTGVGALGGTFDRVEGLTFDPSTRTLFGLQRDTADASIRIVRIDTGTGEAELVGPPYFGLDGRAIEIIPGLPDATVDEYFATHISPSGGCPSYVFSDWGNMPAGLAGDAQGTIQGIPQESGEYLVTFTLGDFDLGSPAIEASIPLRVRPANDMCADAILGADGGYNFATLGATTDGPDAAGPCGLEEWQTLQGDIWYCYRAPCTGTLTASVCDSDFDTVLAVYDNCACESSAEPMGCDDDSCGVAGTGSELSVPVMAGGSYGIRVGGYANHRGYGILQLECAGQPSGACCRPGTCAVETAADCAVGGGFWLGASTTCSPDADGDAVPDACDACPMDPFKQEDPGFCGCGALDRDTDGDAMPDCIDGDDDGDGIPDFEDRASSDRYHCIDADVDGCDDCASGHFDPAADGTDLDADGWCAVGDCDDGYAATYPRAPEINDGVDNQCPEDPGFGLVDEVAEELGFFNPADKTELSWPPQIGAADYQIVRAETPQFFDCLTVGWADPVWRDPEEPPPGGTVFYYLVRALAPHAGSWGRDSAGVERGVPCALP